MSVSVLWSSGRTTRTSSDYIFSVTRVTDDKPGSRSNMWLIALKRATVTSSAPFCSGHVENMRGELKKAAGRSALSWGVRGNDWKQLLSEVVFRPRYWPLFRWKKWNICSTVKAAICCLVYLKGRGNIPPSPKSHVTWREAGSWAWTAKQVEFVFKIRA